MKNLLVLLVVLCGWVGAFAKKAEPVVVAYVTSWTRVMPDPTVMTHINYAFGHVNEQFNGVRIDNEQRLRDIVSLKRKQPKLRVMLSIGGWGSGRFSEMAGSETNRKAFAKDCRRVCNELGLDGIDIDWEYPTQNSAGISASPNDTENFTLLMRDLREALGKKLWLTLASVGSAQFIDFRSCQQYLDVVNVMAYDMGNAPKHHSALYRSKIVGWLCASDAVEAHRKAGVPDEKIVLGMPFYGRGKSGVYMKYRDRDKHSETEVWSNTSKASFLVDEDGELVIGFESPRSIAMKCAYIKEQGLRGAMYWEYADDNDQGDLQRAVWQGVLQSDKQRSKASQRAAQRLASVLKENQKREDIIPDSFFHDWRGLKAEMLSEKDPTAQAIYRAAMAHLLIGNAWRSQSFDSKTKSDPDSIQEWTRDEYRRQSAALYAQALQDVEALHAVKLPDTKPLTEQGKDDGVFGNDVLHLVWQTCVSDLTEQERRNQRVPRYEDIINVYRRHGLREATLMLRLETLSNSPLKGEDEAALLRLRDEYADLDACTEVYMLLADLPDKSNQEKEDLLNAALKRYPRSRQANELRNRIAELRRPSFSAKFRQMYYPDKHYDIPLQIKNMESGSLAVYRLPKGFEFSGEEKDGTKAEQVKRAGTLVETLTIPMQGVKALETKNDTLKWHSPGFGCYAFILDGTTQEKLDRHEPQVCQFDVSALTFMSVALPDNKERVMVTDAMTGEPQQSVKVRFYRRERQEYTLLEETLTDERGIAEIACDGKRNYIYVELSKGEDNAFDKESLGWYYMRDNDDKLAHHLSIYTDRSIYRPGQMVYVGGIAYTQSHDQAPKAEAGAEFALTLIDANGQEVMNHTVKTDEFGTLQDSLQLPKTGLPGHYSLRVGNSWHSFRVEEYRRPTFEVKMDEAPAITLPVDSITLTGKALTYSQWPVANARVTGSYQWQQSWWWKRISPSEQHSIDTLYTDEEGKFSITVPVSKELTNEDLRWGRVLQLSVDVLSMEGETQQGSIRVPLCSTPLRMWGNVPEQQNRESLKPWRFDLYSSNDKTVEGNVLCMLTQDGKEVKNFFVPANRDTIPEVLRSLPSGHYELKAKAEVKGDTASCKANFTIFSITDKRLLGKHDLWLYAPTDTMSAEKPARFQIGTTLPEAWVYCILTAECGVVKDTLLHLSDCATMMEVPYEERFRHHLEVTLMLMHEGRSEDASRDFRLEEPETRLTMRWDTFRDQLQPGQKERWKLTLTRPDGTPASANVMVGMYDASLDALYPYSMYLSIYRGCNRNVSLRVNAYEWYGRYHYASLNLPIHFLPYEGYDFASWNEEYFQGLRMTRGGRTTMRLRGTGANRLEERVYEMVEVSPMVKREYAGALKEFKLNDVKGLEFESVDQALNGQIAGLDIASKEFSGEVMREEAAGFEVEEDASVRSDLSELAFFYPQLRTDSKGQTSIEFTLPEGLTSWHLHGLAHTKDMMTAEWQETVVAKKELMAELTLPRFLRNGDEATLTASIRNASDKHQKGEAILDVYCAEDNWGVKRMKVKFDLEPGKEAVYHMPLKATLDHPVLAVQWIAKGKGSSDGEVRYLPVLSDMQNVTETRTYLLRGDTTMTLNLDGLFANGNPKARNKTLTVEHVAEPIYLALQALPSLTAPVHNDVLSVATAYYGGSVAYHIAHKYPNVRKAIDTWAKDEKSLALESPLVKNQQLADILLNETPWMLEAQQQKASRQRLASLFAEMDQEQRRMTMLSALSARQSQDGSFGWFPGMSGSVWMTSQVASLLVRLGAIKGEWSIPESQILDKAMSFLEKDMHKEVEALRKEKNPTLSLSELRYLYIYIMYRKTLSNSPVKGEDFDFLLSLLKKQAEDLDREPRALAAIVLKRAGEDKKAQALMPRIHELLRHSDGMYLAYPGGSFTSIDRKVQTHVNLMEAVQTVEPKETDLLAKMAEWLIQQKRTQEWEQPIQSADAIYALMQTPLHSEGGAFSGQVSYNNQVKKLEPPKPFTGYVRERIESISKPKELHIEQKGGEGSLAWGSVYAQYQLPAAEVEHHREGMTIRREISIENRNGSMVNGQWSMGDRIHVRYTITADKDYEYVCLRAPRPAATEPAQQLSGYRWQSGLGYYQAMHDASTEYFMDRLPRGTYVIEEDWIVSRDGNFLLPPARLTCLYAPEFQSNTAGEKFKVK
jgi:GH18 family chitinase